MKNQDYRPVTDRIEVESLEQLSHLANLENLTKLTLDRLNVTNLDYLYVGNLSNVTNLNITNCNLSHVSWISSLISLNNCVLKGCQISRGIKSFEGLVSLATLNLEDNPLQDICSDKGNVYNCCEVFANLALNNNLRYLYLSGCTGLKDLSKLTAIKTWLGRSGF